MSWLNDATVTTLEDKEEQSKEAARQNAKQKRDAALNSIVHKWSDGSVVQVRPRDMINFQAAISMGINTDWVLADNSVRRNTTSAELIEAMQSGIDQGRAIWEEYMSTLESF